MRGDEEEEVQRGAGGSCVDSCHVYFPIRWGEPRPYASLGGILGCFHLTHFFWLSLSSSHTHTHTHNTHNTHKQCIIPDARARFTYFMMGLFILHYQAIPRKVYPPPAQI
jgi:hypothetical protein